MQNIAAETDLGAQVDAFVSAAEQAARNEAANPALWMTLAQRKQVMDTGRTLARLVLETARQLSGRRGPGISEH